MRLMTRYLVFASPTHDMTQNGAFLSDFCPTRPSENPSEPKLYNSRLEVCGVGSLCTMVWRHLTFERTCCLCRNLLPLSRLYLSPSHLSFTLSCLSLSPLTHSLLPLSLASLSHHGLEALGFQETSLGQSVLSIKSCRLN